MARLSTLAPSVPTPPPLILSRRSAILPRTPIIVPASLTAIDNLLNGTVPSPHVHLGKWRAQRPPDLFGGAIDYGFDMAAPPIPRRTPPISALISLRVRI